MDRTQAGQIADAIFGAAQSGSAAWDEAGGPAAVMREFQDRDRFEIIIPSVRPEDGSPVIITVGTGMC
jgi:hypothetical protein